MVVDFYCLSRRSVQVRIDRLLFIGTPRRSRYRRIFIGAYSYELIYRYVSPGAYAQVHIYRILFVITHLWQHIYNYAFYRDILRGTHLSRPIYRCAYRDLFIGTTAPKPILKATRAEHKPTTTQTLLSEATVRGSRRV